MPDHTYHYYMFHKPFGCVTARRDDRYPTVMDYFQELHNDRLSPVNAACTSMVFGIELPKTKLPRL